MNIIDKIYERNFEFVRGFEVHTGVKESVADIYPDKAHFIYELLQNAEDTGATETTIELYHNKLVFIHNGRSFNETDIEGICTIGASSKRDDETTIGKFGVGFKSVFLYTNSPHIWSENYSFKIENLILPSEIDTNAKHKNTTFEFPFNNEDKPKKIAFTEIKESLDEISEITLLFLSNIKIINVKISFDNKESFTKISKSNYQKNLVKISYSNKINRDDNTYYLVFSKKSEKIPQNINLAFQLKFDVKNKIINIEKKYSDQFTIVPASPGLVSVSFPLVKETSKLKFFINAPFITDRARSSLKNNKINDELFKELQTLFFETVEQLKVMNFLNREFYEILPISRDELEGNYEELRIFLIKILKENNFLKTGSNKYVKSENLLKGNSEIRELISETDLNFIINGKNKLFDKFWAMPVNISSRVNILYNDLDIENFDDKSLLDFLELNADVVDDNYDSIEYWTPKVCDNDFMNWLSEKNINWHQNFYSYLYSLEEDNEKKIDEYYSNNWLIYRLDEKKYSINENLFFPDNIKNETLNTIDEKLLIEGKEKKLKANVKSFFKHVGIKEFDEEEKIKLILENRYSYKIKNFDPKIEDMLIFLKYYENNRKNLKIFKNKEIFLNEGEKFCYPSMIYVNKNDKGFEEFIELTNNNSKRSSSHYKKISVKYKKLQLDYELLLEFAIALGALNKIPIYIRKINREHPEYLNLIADLHKTPFKYQTGVNVDYFIKNLTKILEPQISKELSLTIWNLINSKYSDNIFRASFKPNNKYILRHATSTLMIALRDNRWLYSANNEYLKPSDLSKETLNSIYSFDENWEGLKYLEFGKNEQKNIEILEHRKNAIKQLGIKEVYVDVLKKIQEKFSVDEIYDFIEKESLNKDNNGISDKTPKNPELRTKRVKAQSDEAPDRFFEIRKRSVPAGASTETKNLATKYLIQQYTHEEQLFCQICNKEVPFKLNNGNFYFEKVRFLDNFKRDHRYNFIALCANHSAMFQYTLDENEDLVDKIKNIKNNYIEVKIGQSLHKIHFTNTHIIDLKAVIESENK